jgi:hypothetical protein
MFYGCLMVLFDYPPGHEKNRTSTQCPRHCDVRSHSIFLHPDGPFLLSQKAVFERKRYGRGPEEGLVTPALRGIATVASR